MIESPHLFTKKEIQTIGTDTTRDLQSSLQVPPEALDAIGVDGVSHIHSGLVVDLVMSEGAVHARIPGPAIGVHDCIRRKMRMHTSKQCLALQVGYGKGNDLSRVS